MRHAAVLIAAAALAGSASAQPQPAPVTTAAEIAAIEQAWGQAFLKGDRAYLEKLLAPEFKLMRAEANQPLFTPRAEWLANYERFVFHAFDVRTVDVLDAGDTAVATVTGRWKVGMRGRDGAREENFILSDTFVKRGGAWQAVYRHSTPFAPPPPAAAAAGTERGR